MNKLTVLTRLQILGFQHHKDLRIKLGPVTVITGPTDAGKSAVVRALRWLAHNKPGGLAYRNWACGEVRVRLEIDGHKITRIKSETTNTYKLDGKAYKAFGAGVPPAISRLLNINELNTQLQAAPHFWLAATPGQVAKELNAIVDLDIIDKTLSHLDKKHRQAKARLAVATERLDVAKEEFNKTTWAPRFLTGAKQLRQLAKDSHVQAAHVAHLGRLTKQATLHHTALRNAQRGTAAASIALENGATADKARRGATTLQAAIGRFCTAQQQTARRLPVWGPIAALYAKAVAASKDARTFGELVAAATALQIKCKIAKEDLSTASIASARYTKGEKCPVCNQLFSPSSVAISI